MLSGQGTEKKAYVSVNGTHRLLSCTNPLCLGVHATCQRGNWQVVVDIQYRQEPRGLARGGCKRLQPAGAVRGRPREQRGSAVREDTFLVRMVRCSAGTPRASSALRANAGVLRSRSFHFAQIALAQDDSGREREAGTGRRRYNAGGSPAPRARATG